MKFIKERVIGKLGFMLCQRRKPSREELDFWLGSRARRRLGNSRFIGVTGSAGKSTCSSLLHHLLSERYIVAASLIENTPRVLARRLCQVERKDAFVVMEMSGHEAGVLDRSCALVQPEMGIVISVSNDHYANFRGIDNVIKEKSTLVSRVAASGRVFINSDDPAVLGMAPLAQAKVITFGCSQGSDYQAQRVRLDDEGNLCFDCCYKSELVSFKLALFGLHFLPSALAAIACANQCGIPLEVLKSKAESYTSLPGRCGLYQLMDGRTVICDTVKAPYSTLGLAIGALDAFPRSRPRRIVLGNISDYPGAFGPKLRRIAVQALAVADQLILHRPPAGVDRLIAEHGSDKVKVFDRVSDIQAFLRKNGTPNDVLLLKGSSVNHLESLLLPWLGRMPCDREPCGFKHSCFSCQYGFLMPGAGDFPKYHEYKNGLVRKVI